MDVSGATEGHLVLFDRQPNKTWNEKLFHNLETVDDNILHVWGC